MKNLELKASLRVEKPNVVRQKGFIPAVVYGKGIQPISIEVDKKDVYSIFSQAANRNILISLLIKKGDKVENIPVLAHDYQRDFLTDQIIHVDFLKVNMEEEIRTKVQLDFVGIPVGVKTEGGILVHSLRQVEVKCLPNNIPEKIVVDVSSLKIGQSLHVSDIVPPEGVTIVTPKDETIVRVSSPTEEEVPTAEAVSAEAVSAEATSQATSTTDKSSTEQKQQQSDTKAKAQTADDSKTKAAQKQTK